MNNSKKDLASISLSVWIIILFAISMFSFWPHYLSVIRTPLPWYIHVHFALMILWMGLLFLQPLLIRNQHYALHRTLGRTSFVVIPLVLLFSYFMLQFGYARILDEFMEQGTLSLPEATHKARVDIGLGFYYFFILLLFYPLAIYYRKQSHLHSRFMIASSLSLVGPILDRAFYQLAVLLKVNTNFHYEYVSFLLIYVILFALLYYDSRKGQSLVPHFVCLAFLLCSHVGYVFLLDSQAWQGFVGLVL